MSESDDLLLELQHIFTHSFDELFKVLLFVLLDSFGSKEDLFLSLFFTNSGDDYE